MSIMRTTTIAVLSAVAAAIVVVLFLGRGSIGPQTANQESLYDRVLAAGILRCAYVVYPPGLLKDPNTGDISGVFADAIEEVATNLSLKVEWTEEVGWGTMIEGLRANRYDMICSPVWANATRARFVDFSDPLFFSGIGAYVRADDNRFAASLDGLNAQGIKIATIDGEMSDILATAQFPQAAKVSLPQLSDNSQILLNVAEGRADVTFVEPFIANQFLKSHPGALKNLVADRPLRVFPNTWMFNKGEPEFKSMVDVALAELVNSGRIDGLLRQYAGDGLSFYPVERPYATAAIAP